MNARPNLHTARLLAGVFASLKEMGVTDRRIFDGILRSALEENPAYLGVWTVWEPNALDGRDAEFANTKGHDATGRYVPLWNRSRGRIEVEPNCYYSVPGLGDWYLIPKARGVETVVDPYEFPFCGRRIFITSQVAPIFHDGQCVGVAGIDISVDAFAHPKAAMCEELLNRGYIFLGPRGEVTHWSERTRELLARYFGPGAQKTLPALIELQIRKSRSEGFAMPPQFIQKGSECLILRYVQHPEGDRFLVIVEETSAPAAACLSEREREVLQWIARGKANGEIAIILGISLHTVKRHVEKVLAKLGVESRHAAALSVLQALPEPGAQAAVGLPTYFHGDGPMLSASA
jgi:DNA-binding CsgD family transcriptional regulator